MRQGPRVQTAHLKTDYSQRSSIGRVTSTLVRSEAAHNEFNVPPRANFQRFEKHRRIASHSR